MTCERFCLKWSFGATESVYLRKSLEMRLRIPVCSVNICNFNLIEFARCHCYSYEEKMLQEKRSNEGDISVTMDDGLAGVFFTVLVASTTCGWSLNCSRWKCPQNQRFADGSCRAHCVCTVGTEHHTVVPDGGVSWCVRHQVRISVKMSHCRDLWVSIGCTLWHPTCLARSFFTASHLCNLQLYENCRKKTQICFNIISVI